MRLLGIFRLSLVIGAAVLALLPQPSTAQEHRNLAVIKASPQLAEKRVALVIGNSAYQKGPLKNPVNDAADMAQKLRTLGFDVVERQDLKTSQIGRTLREFRSRLSAGAVAVFFYAGHGLQIKGENYLPSVDADIEGEEDVPNQSIAVRQVMELLEDAKTGLNLAILDACRNNPYARSFRSGTEGLARVSAPSGSLMAFATRPGSVAADGTGRNGLYTTHLLRAMDTPNQPIEMMLKDVASAVKSSSRGGQEPWMEGSIEGNFYFRVAAASASAMPTPGFGAGPTQQEAIDRAVQEAVRRSKEDAARERAEMQASMQQLIEQALARQNAAAATAAAANAAASPGAASAAAVAPPTTVAALAQPAGAPISAALAPFSGRAPQAGDEWEYAVKEKVFGKNWKIVWRVKGASSGVGVMEELMVNGQAVQERVFDGRAIMVGIPTDAAQFFSSHWNGDLIPSDIATQGIGDCVAIRCLVTKLRLVNKESVRVAAGNFEALFYEGDVYVTAMRSYAGKIRVWYSPEHRRLIKQVIVRTPPSGLNPRLAYSLDETVELVAVRTRP